MENANRPPEQTEHMRDRGTENGQALVEYSLIIVLIVIGCLTVLYTFQDSVINGLWGATRTIVAAMGG
jgi:Flp pilus assembly pilin Flp